MSNSEHLKGFLKNYKLSNNLIHREECTQCFKTCRSKFGINICLTCFNAGCVKNEHYLNHYRNTRHSIIMNFIQTKHKQKQEINISNTENCENQLVYNFDAPNNNSNNIQEPKYVWLDQTQFYCLDCSQSMNFKLEANLKLEELQQKILNSESEFLVNNYETKKQHEQLTSCKHIDELVQTNKNCQKTYKQDGKLENLTCNSCTISENLQVCLHCGFVGCGRRNFDGSGGNNHALEHCSSPDNVSQLKHVVVMKIGTFSTNKSGDRADLYCYSCDESRIDLNIRKKLEQFGLVDNSGEGNDLKATVKTTAELQMKQNLEFDQSKTYEHGKELKMLNDKRNSDYCNLVGLFNLGNSCYMSALLQVLMHLPDFRKRYFVYGANHIKECRLRDSSKCSMCQQVKLATGLHSSQQASDKKTENISEDMAKQRNEFKDNYSTYINAIKPRMFKQLICQDHCDFRTNQQQDSYEFLHFLLQKIDLQEQMSQNFVGFDENASQNKGLTSIFRFKLENRLECSSCHRVSYSSHKATDLSLPIPYDIERLENEEKAFESLINDSKRSGVKNNGVDLENNIANKRKKLDEDSIISLSSCLDLFCSPEQIDYNCRVCEKRTKAYKKVHFQTFPDVLVIHLRRFVFVDQKPRKIHFNISIPENISLDKQIGKGLQDGEVEFPEEKFLDENSKNTFTEPNLKMLEELKLMGFSDNRCRQALIKVQNSSVEQALNWILEHMNESEWENDTASKNDDYQKTEALKNSVDQNLVSMLVSMGFDSSKSESALRQTNNDLNRAIDQLYSRIDEEPSLTQQSSISQNEAIPNYSLIGFVTHIGKTTNYGHYVSHIRKKLRLDDKHSQVYYNDQKVSESEQPLPSGKGYILFFARDSYQQSNNL